MEEGTIKLFHSDYDYAPVFVFDEYGNKLMSGDNSHNSGYEDYARGYAEGSGLELLSIGIYEDSDLIEKEELLKEYGIYEEYLEMLRF